MKKVISELCGDIVTKFKPVSVFLYGSRARGDFQKDSDYEIWILYPKDNKVTRVDLQSINLHKNINLYPFEYESFVQYEVDTPFPEKIYIRELIESGMTLAGEKKIEEFTKPSIKILDLIETARFNIAYALAAVLSHRHSDQITARAEFHKSCLFGVRSLIIATEKKFPLTYFQIFSLSLKLNLGDEYNSVIQHAMDVRSGANIDEIKLYKNISLLNKVVRKHLMQMFDKEGNATILR